MALCKSKINYIKTRHNFISIPVLFLLLVPIGLSGQGVVKGRITDSKTNYPVYFADIACCDKSLLTKSNSKGEFMFVSPEFPVTLKIRKTGYKEEIIVVNSPGSSILVPLIPIEIQKKFLNKKSTLLNVSLLKKAIEKLRISAASARPDLAERELVYCRIASSVDSVPESFFESYAYMNVNEYSFQGYQSAISRFTSTDNVIPGIPGNKLEFKIDPFIKLPFFVERYINRTGSFEQNGNQVAIVGFDMGETETIYYINLTDTSIIYIKKRVESRIKNKLQGSPQTWLDGRNTSAEISFSPGIENRKSYQIDYFTENEVFRLMWKKKPDQIISRSTLFDVIPDSSLINKAVKEHVLNETFTGAKQQINFNAKFSLSDKTTFFDSEIQKLLLKPYNPVFWAQNTLIKPDPTEQKQIQSWENDNRFYSVNRLSPANEIIGVDSLVYIMNRNIVSIEKVYLEPDRPDYLAGDTIWFSAFVIDNLLMDSTSISKILYVDLINADNILEKHLKLLIKNGRARGDFSLNKELKSGIFRIRAYTQWMRNFQGDYLFEKDIPVYQSDINNLIVVDPVIKNSNEGDSVNLYLQALLPSGYKEIEKYLDVFVRLNDSVSVRKSFRFKDDFHGSMGFFVPAALSCSFADLKLTLSGMTFVSEQRLSIPLNAGINIQFFPESGKMVAGINTVIAYKAVDNKGNPAEFEADIIDENQKVVEHITGDRSGVGKFNFTPQLNQRYKAIVNLSGNKYVFNLPVTEPKGYILTFNSDSSLIFIKNNQTKNKSRHYLLASVRGAVYTSVEANLNTETIQIHLPFEMYPKGIVQITLFDSLFRPLAERLVFNNRPDQKMLIHVETDKKEYRPREKVNLTINVTDAAGNPVESSLSLAVADASKTDSLLYSSDIESYLYLASELKGEIDYSLINLSDTTPSGARNIDLVMTTQGWRNYLWNSIRYTNSIKDLYPVEKGFYIDGTILNNVNHRPVSDYKLNFLDFKTGFNNVVKVDEKNCFKIDIPVFYDTHFFVIQSRNKKDRIDDISFTLDTVSVPEITYRKNELPYVSYKPGWLKAINEKFANMDSPDELNIKYIEIPEVVIKAKSRVWYSTPDITINLETKDPTGKKYSSLFQMIAEEFGDKAFTGHGFGSGGKSYPPILVVNGNPMTAEYCPPCYGTQYPWASNIPVNEISNVKFYEAGSEYSVFLTPPPPPPVVGGQTVAEPSSEYSVPYSAFSTEGHIYTSVVSFTTYSNTFRGNPTGTIVWPFRGIYQAREFYQPDYKLNNNNKPDNRTTVYWNPEIKTDSTGKANVSFYNSDLKGKALIKVSGVSYRLKNASSSVSHYVSH